MSRLGHNSLVGNRRLGITKRRIKMIKIHSCLDALFCGLVKRIQLTRDRVRQRDVHSESSGFIKSEAFLEQLKDNFRPTKNPTSPS
jgi:hypothetical protein